MGYFSDKTVFVSGAASGIGRATALRFAAEGAAVFCVDLQEEALRQTAHMIEERGGQSAVGVCDISAEEQVQKCMAACINHFGKLDVLVNLAGILKFAHFAEMEFKDWRKIMSVNLDGTFLLCKEALPHLEKNSGCIINAASSSALVGLPYGVAYSASKGGVLMLTRSLAVEYIRRGVRVNCICPAGIKTPLAQETPVPEGAEMELLLGHENVAGFWGEPEDVAGVILFLASEDASRVNGESVRVDAGTLA